MMRAWTTSLAVPIGLSLGPAASNGLARFAYGLLLPAMQSDLGWTYTQAGWLNTANAIGYLAGAVLTFLCVDRVGARRLFMLGMMATPFTLLGSAFVSDIVGQSLFRSLAGVAGAAVFIAGGALAAALRPESPGRNALSISLYFGGAGIGMILSGAILPLLLDRMGMAAWSVGWVVLASLALLCVPPAILAARACPVGGNAGGSARAPLPVRGMVGVVLGYFLFAVGYLVYLTFLVALMAARDASPTLIAITWGTVGVGVVLAPFLWRGIIARSTAGGALALASVATAAGTVLPIAVPSIDAALVLSALVFGLSVFIAPTAVTSFARKRLEAVLWGRAVALFTIVFALGQTIGPVLAGLVSDRTGSVSQGMAAAGAILLTAAAVAWLQKRPGPIPADISP